MALLEEFKSYLGSHGWSQKKIIVALSGGLDSMCLAALLHGLGISLVLAHCNFGLRGEESDGDEHLVRAWAGKMNIPLYVQRFNVPQILEEHGGNMEEIARSLRYDWFERLRQTLGFDLIATAHHQQDNVETLLMNFFRGTGITGLHGILPQQGKIIRPLLTFEKEALKQYALGNAIPWREDSSNKDINYLRNAIRQQLWPEIERVFPQARQALHGNTDRFREAEMLYREAIDSHRKRLLEQRQKDWYIPILKLRRIPALKTVLFELLKPFGFTSGQMPGILHLLDAEPGKWIASGAYRLWKDRNFLIITAIEICQSTLIKIDFQQQEQKIEWTGGLLSITPLTPETRVGQWERKNDGEEFLALSEPDFPLILRPVREGDYFYPLGMNRKKKKLGRFLRDQKVPLSQKPDIWVLESRHRIAWVLGHRIDERFKVNRPGRGIVKMQWKKDKGQTGK
ncbi:MAG TPA: tRNA lysidine(34) synthetase TilS [Edaphocola sp.]|nr:tRNA lysidine(34) synthetase TilS [Edaphocola sp.]